MSAWLMLFRIEARRSVVVWMVPIMMVVAVRVVWSSLESMSVVLWTESTMLARELLIFVGPLAAGLAAWMGARERRSGIEKLLASTPLAAPSRRIITWTASAAWAVIAYLVVIAVHFATVALLATWGRPILWPVGGALLAVPAFAATGYVLGVFLPGRFTPPMVAVTLIFGLLVMGEVGRALGAPMWMASPVAGLYSSVWYGIQPDIALPQALLLAGLTGMVLVSLTFRSRPGRRAWGVLLGALVLASLGMLMLAFKEGEGPRSWERIPYQPVCRGDVLPVCVHPAYQALLPDLAPRLAALLQPLAGLSSAPQRVEQMPSVDVDDQEAIIEGRTLLLTLNTDSSATGAALSLAAHALVHERGAFSEAQGALKARLLQRAGMEIQCDRIDPYVPGLATFTSEECAVADRFARLAPEQQRLWLERHYAGLRQGLVGPEALP